MVEYYRKDQENMKFVVLLLGLCCFHQASGALHSFKAFYTATTGISNFPEFTTAAIVDDVLVNTYSSFTKKVEPRTEWMKNSEGPEYWKRQSDIIVATEPVFKANIATAMNRFNQSGGVHVNQVMYGCEWDSVTGDTKGYQLDGYDGEDFLALDLENMRWIAPVSQAVPTKQKWDKDRALLENQKQYFTHTCIDWLKKYIQYGRRTLERKVPPEVSLFQKDSSSSAVVCHATGFYPEGVMITWKRDGKEVTDDINVGETLPNADGNFQKRVVLTVPLEDRKNRVYTCEVTHSSGEPVVMILNEDEIKRGNPDSVPLGPIIGVVVGLLVVIAVIAGFVVWRNKKKSGFTRANTDESSQSSGEKA